MNELSEQEAQLVSEHQMNLLHAAERFFGNTSLPKAIRRAFLNTPRHKFATRFYSSQKRQWVDLATTPIREHIAELYSDHPLCIYRDESGCALSTVSQPSLVLYMLDLLDLKPGHHVFELGGGSGWNAALMGQLVGKGGTVVSIEIIESLAGNAQASLNELKLDQVDFRSGDASLGTDSQEAFDRGVFTASAWELPTCFFDQIKDQGLLLFVIKAQPNYDLLCLLRKTDANTFQSELHFRCSFVPVTGSSTLPDQEPISLAPNTLPPATTLAWDDIKIPGPAIPDFLEFAKLVFDCQQTYLLPNDQIDFDEEFWGIENKAENSLVIFNEDRLQAYGSDTTLVQLRRAAKRWLKAGQPENEDLKLSIHRLDTAPAPTNDQWTVQRGSSALLWSL